MKSLEHILGDMGRKRLLLMSFVLIGLVLPFILERERFYSPPVQAPAVMDTEVSCLLVRDFDEDIPEMVFVERKASSEKVRAESRSSASSPKFSDWHWKGGEVLPPEMVMDALREVFIILEREPSHGFRRLLLETTAVESHFGRALQYSGAYGLTQILASTARAAHKYAAASKDKRYTAVLKKTFNKRLSAVENLKHNVLYNVAVFVVYCETYGKALEKLPRLETREGRWAFYGTYWGAVGKGGATTRKRYFTRASEIGNWLSGTGKNATRMEFADSAPINKK